MIHGASITEKREANLGNDYGSDSQRIHLSFIIFGDVRSWRNWQTHQLEVLAVVIPWRFESSRPHHPIRGLEFA